jgi:hypothetical protein
MSDIHPKGSPQMVLIGVGVAELLNLKYLDEVPVMEAS